jgi:hypothetical protein
MNIMASSSNDSWQTGRPWQIVSADLDLAHVFLPLKFNFTPHTREDGLQGYKITHLFQAPYPDSFTESFLVCAGHTQPTFKTIADRDTLPNYESKWAADYTKVALRMASHMDKDRDVKRLEGIIKVPCHAHAAPLATGAVAGHPPMWIKTLIHFYQFSNVIDGDRPLLVARAPLSPMCPLNGDGTALGLS